MPNPVQGVPDDRKIFDVVISKQKIPYVTIIVANQFKINSQRFIREKLISLL